MNRAPTFLGEGFVQAQSFNAPCKQIVLASIYKG